MILLAFLTWGLARAETVLVQSPQARRIEYQAMLRAHTEYISPTQHYLANHPSTENRERLFTALTEAQKTFLQASPLEATQKFMAVLALQMEDDWAREQREIFLLTYLRLAQLETDPEARDRWLRESLLLGDDLSADASLVPPPLLARRNEFLHIPTQKWREAYADGWSKILVNGKACPDKDCSAWTRARGRVRVTFLSDEWLPQTLIANSEDLATLQPQPVAWTEGECGKARPHAKIRELGERKIFWDMACEKPLLTNKQLQPALVATPSLPIPVTETRRPLYKSPWLWTGVGVGLAVTAVLAVRALQHHHDSPQTTTTYGY